jgi:hypothetical protein
MKLSLKIDFIILLIITIITTWLSIAVGVAVFIITMLLKRKISFLYFFYVIYIFSLIAFTQYSTIKEGDYDVIRYYGVYYLMSQVNTKDAIIMMGATGDLFFYAWEFILTRIFPDDPRVMSFFFIFVTSSLNLLSINNVRRYINNLKSENKVDTFSHLHLFLWVISFFLIINFPNYTNAFRQFFAMALFFFAITQKALGKKYYIFILFAILSHWSMLIYTVVFLIAINFKIKDKAILIAAPIINVFIQFILPLLPFFADKIKAYTEGGEILGIDKTLIVINLAVQVLLLLYMQKVKKIFNDYYVLLIVMLAYTIIFLTNSTIITRHFFFVTNYIVVIILFFHKDFQQLITKNKFQNQVIFAMLFMLVIFFNVKQMSSGQFIYQFFSQNLYLQSASTILTSPFPHEIIR